MAAEAARIGGRVPRRGDAAATGEKARSRRAPARDSAVAADVGEAPEPDVNGDEEPTRRETEPDRTVRGELTSIVREAALEVLGPIARKATTQAAKYAVSRGPALAKETIAPRLKDTLGASIDEAGGPGAFAKNALSAVSVTGGLRSKLGIGAAGKDDASMAQLIPVHESLDVAVPLEMAYNQFTQFEDFARFMEGVAKVEQVDDVHLVWRQKVWGRNREWELEITDQRPNERIVCKSVNGAEAVGVVSFHRLGDRLTRIEMNLLLRPPGVLGKTASGLAISRVLRSDLSRFKSFIELGEEETGGWRGRIEEGDVVEGDGARARKPRDKERGKRRAMRRRDRREREREEEAYESEEEDEYESEAAYDEEQPDAGGDDKEPGDESEEEEEPDDEEEAEEEEEPEEEPVARRRPVRRRPPARPMRQSRGRG